MRLGSGTSEMMQALFVIMVSMLVISLFVPKIGEPTFRNYNDNQAHLLAQEIALSVNALSATERGSVTKTLEIPWDIELYLKDGKKLIKVSHESPDADSEDKGEVVILGDVGTYNLRNRNIISITKLPGEPVKIE